MPVKNAIKPVVVVLGSLLFTAQSLAEETWQLSAATGTALNYQSDISVDMDGSANIDSEDTEWHSNSFSGHIYHSLRLSRLMTPEYSLEFEYLHHKMKAEKDHLDSRIQNFTINNYDTYYINYATYVDPTSVVRAGAGVVSVRSDVTIDNQRRENYTPFAGVGFQLGIEKIVYEVNNLSFSLEAKVSYSYAEFDIGGDSATIPNTALHFLGRINYSL